MIPKKFYQVSRELFGDILKPHGFSCDGSKYATFYRQLPGSIYHFVQPALRSGNAWYRVAIFPSSPIIDEGFDSGFPDEVGIPTMNKSYLTEKGIDSGQSFNCKTEGNMRRRLQMTVRLLLESIAMPYLDNIRSISDMTPLLRHEPSLAFALFSEGHCEEALPLLMATRKRFGDPTSPDANDPNRIALLERTDAMIAKCDVLLAREPPSS